LVIEKKGVNIFHVKIVYSFLELPFQIYVYICIHEIFIFTPKFKKKNFWNLKIGVNFCNVMRGYPTQYNFSFVACTTFYKITKCPFQWAFHFLKHPAMFCWLFYHDTTKYHMKRNQHMSLVLVWMTQPPWLHQFHFKWTSVHPITKHGVVIEVESFYFIFEPTFQEILFSTMDLSCSPNYPIQNIYSHLPYSYTFVMDFFFQNSFLLLSLSLL
jgi:hypothetical protein